MIVFPAIDLKNGQVVRLAQGDFARKTVYNKDPLDQAKKFEAIGAKWLHLIDLDGAREGVSQNKEMILKIKRETSLKIQLGGGIRSIKTMEELFEQGIERLVIGTLAIEKPMILKEAVQRFGKERLAVGIDVKEGKIVTHGWLKGREENFISFAREIIQLGISQIIYTDVSRDGMLTGPDFNSIKKLISSLKGVKLIASGGVSSIEDLIKLKETGVYGVIIGKALYQGLINLDDIFKSGVI